jgi:hypothetical protein
MSGDEPELEGPKGFRSRFLVYRNAAQGPYADGVWNVIQFNAEIIDTLGEVDIAAPWRFHPRRAGYYLIGARTRWALIAGEMSRIWIRCTNPLYDTYGYSSSAGLAGDNQSISNVMHLDVGDTVWVETMFDVPIPPVNRSIQANPEQTAFFGHRLS